MKKDRKDIFANSSFGGFLDFSTPAFLCFFYFSKDFSHILQMYLVALVFSLIIYDLLTRKMSSRTHATSFLRS